MGRVTTREGRRPWFNKHVCLFVCLFVNPSQNLPTNQLASNIPRFHLFDQSDFSEVRPVSTVSTFPLLLTEPLYTLTNHTIPPIFTRQFQFHHPFHSISTPYPSFHTSFTPLFYYTPASLPNHFNHNYNHNHFSRSHILQPSIQQTLTTSHYTTQPLIPFTRLKTNTPYPFQLLTP